MEEPLRERNGASAKKGKTKGHKPIPDRRRRRCRTIFYRFIPSITYSTIPEAVLRLKNSQDQSSERGTS